jgi:hypothetical protein
VFIGRLKYKADLFYWSGTAVGNGSREWQSGMAVSKGGIDIPLTSALAFSVFPRLIEKGGREKRIARLGENVRVSPAALIYRA